MGRYHFPKYDTMGEFIAHVDGHPYGPTYDDGWSGTATYGEALGLARDGWDEQRPTVDAVRSEVIGQLTEIIDMQFHPVLDVSGCAIDMGEFMTGVPECMIQFPTDPAPSIERVIRIVMDPGGNSSVTTTALANRAGAVAALLEVLQLSGRSLEVWVASPVSGDGFSSHSPVVCAHRAGTECDINSMMFFCGHPSFLRRLIFAHRDMDGLHSMGSSHRISQDLADSVNADLIVQRAEHRASGEPDAGRDPLAWVLYMCKQIGIA